MLLSGRIDEATASMHRDPLWTESLAVDDHSYLAKLKYVFGVRGINKRITERSEDPVFRDGNES